MLYRQKFESQISDRVKLESLVNNTYNLGNVTSKRNVGGGFQTNTEPELKFTLDPFFHKLQEKRKKELKSIKFKINQLKKFDLGISSVHSETPQPVS